MEHCCTVPGEGVIMASKAGENPGLGMSATVSVKIETEILAQKKRQYTNIYAALINVLFLHENLKASESLAFIVVHNHDV